MNISHIQLIECSKEILLDYLEKKFYNNMNYDNYGEWEIDHIKPISLCDSNNIDQNKRIF